MNNTLRHNKLLDDILFHIGSSKNIRLWVRVVGFDEKRKIKYGIPGESDLQGIIYPGGRMLSIEVKTGKGRLTGEQKRWRNMILKFGGIHIVARSVEEVLAELKPYL